ncbi:MAG: cobD [Pseudonocardiales bacterium]|nr:cobD [Pseudonocardiales bacterium]
MTTVDLRHHGDRDLGPGLIDLAVNVRAGMPPAWLTAQLAQVDLAAYPDAEPARAAVAARHGRAVEEVLLTAGAAEAFVLLARVLRPAHAVVVHPQFTEPEAALRAAGHEVTRCELAWPFRLDPALIPPTADLVFVGNPTNPTSVLHPSETLRALARPGRVLVIDEAFGDCIPGEPESLASARDVPGLIVIRSLTKTWGLAGLRAGYLLGPSHLVEQLARAQPLWSVSSPALAACIACTTPTALAEAGIWADGLEAERAALVTGLESVAGLEVVPAARASFVLIRSPGRPDLGSALRRCGYAVRRGDTFPGLGVEYLRVAVRDQATSARFVETLRKVMR